MADASFIRRADDIRLTAAAAIAVGEARQLPDGSAGVYPAQAAAASGDRVRFSTTGQYTMPKAAGVVLLDGGRAYWDRSARQVTFRKVNDRDFLLGRVVGDAAAGDATCAVNINVAPAYDLDLARDALRCVPVGTQALGGFLPAQRRGGAVKLLVSATSEAQKVDALGKDGFAVGAKAIIEMGVEVVSLGSGSSPVLCVGVASGTHATAVTSIANYLVCRIDGNATKIQFESADGTHTVAEADSTKTLTAGTRFEVWMDLRAPASVKLYVDGVQVLSGTTFDFSAASNTLYLLAHLVKTATADTFEADIDWLRARFQE